MKGGNTKSVNRIENMELVSINNLSKRDTIGVCVRASVSEILGKGPKTGIEIAREKNRALRRERGKSRDEFSKTVRIVG